MARRNNIREPLPLSRCGVLDLYCEHTAHDVHSEREHGADRPVAAAAAAATLLRSSNQCRRRRRDRCRSASQKPQQHGLLLRHTYYRYYNIQLIETSLACPSSGLCACVSRDRASIQNSLEYHQFYIHAQRKLAQRLARIYGHAEATTTQHCAQSTRVHACVRASSTFGHRLARRPTFKIV